MAEVGGSDRKRCRATRKDGSPCAAPVLGTGAFCFAHDPDRAAQRDEARRKGGANSATSQRAERLVPSHMRPVLGAVFRALQDVRSGAITPAQASAIASLAGAAVKVYQVGIIEDRVAELEAAAARRGGLAG